MCEYGWDYECELGVGVGLKLRGWIIVRMNLSVSVCVCVCDTRVGRGLPPTSGQGQASHLLKNVTKSCGASAREVLCRTPTTVVASGSAILLWGGSGIYDEICG